MSLGGLMIDAVWMAIEMHTFYPSRIACLFYRQWQSKASNKTNPRDAGLVINGGEGGIRTLDTLLTYTPLAGERLQPLGHFSESVQELFLIGVSRCCLFDAIENFLSVHRDFLWRLHAYPNLIPLDAQHGDGDVVSNHQGFTHSSRQNQHVSHPC